MASFCSKCGAELSPGAQSCTACGAPVAASARRGACATSRCSGKARKQRAQNHPDYPRRVHWTRHSRGWSLRVLRLASCPCRPRLRLRLGCHPAHPRRHAHGKYLRDLQCLRPRHRHLPRRNTGKGSMSMTLPTGSMVSAVYFTSDSKDQVLSFLQNQVWQRCICLRLFRRHCPHRQQGPQESVVVTITKGSSENEGKTEIHIVHTTSTKPS